MTGAVGCTTFTRVIAEASVGLAASDGWLATWSPAVTWLAAVNSLHTRRAYTTALRQFVAVASSPLSEVVELHVSAYKAILVGRRLAPRTVRQRILIISSFFVWAIERQFHPGPNPVARVPLPSAGREPFGLALDAGQVADLVAAAGCSRDRAIIWLLAEAGLRAAELCDLQERDLHLDERHRATTLTVRSGKGGRGRVVELGSNVAEALYEYTILPPGRFGRVDGPTKPLFQWLDGSGKGISYRTVHRVVATAAAAAGLGHVAPHDLRRTYVTLALDSGEPAPRVQRQVGHASMEQTCRYYREGR